MRWEKFHPCTSLSQEMLQCPVRSRFLIFSPTQQRLQIPVCCISLDLSLAQERPDSVVRARILNPSLVQETQGCPVCSIPAKLSLTKKRRRCPVYSRGRDRLAGLVVEASDSGAEDPGFESRWRRDFSGLSHTSDLKIGTPVATLPGAWHYRVSTGAGRPGVSIL